MKKQRYVWFIVVFLLPFTSILSLNTSFTIAGEERHFVVGTQDDPYILDPHDCYDTDSMNVLYQILEGLYAFNLSSPDGEIVPRLAAAMGTWSPDYENLTVPLRTDVTFHDGSAFNATVVKWNFDRLIHHLIDLDDLATSFVFKVNGQWTLNRCEIVDMNTVKFVLNFPNMVWESLLAESFTFIFKPDLAYWDAKISTSDIPIGTGPFMLDSYEIGNKLDFSYYPDYYRGWFSDHIETMEYRIIPDPELSQSIVNYSIDFASSVQSDYLDDVETDPYLTQAERYKGPVIYFIQMNVAHMPLEVRLASQFVWNNSYWVNETYGGDHFDLHGPIPDGLQYHHDDGSFYNGSYDGIWPHMDVTTARQYILNCPELAGNTSANGLTSGSSDAAWIAVAESVTPVAWYNFTRYFSSVTQYASLQLQENLKQIGIRLEILEPLPWSTYFDNYYNNPAGQKYLSYSFGGWGPDYYDPIAMIEPVYKTGVHANLFELSDPYFDWLINETYSATGSDRRDLFYEIQEYFVSDIVPNFFIMQIGRSGFVYHNQRLSNVDHLSNIMDILYFYPSKYAAHYSPNTPIVNPITPDPHTSGNVHVDWIPDLYIDIYYVYKYSSPITEINGSVQYLGSTSNSYWNDPGNSEGVYYYAVQAYNSSGYSELSNTVGITVDIPGPDAPVLNPIQSPDFDGLIDLNWNDVAYTSYYNVYRYFTPITELNGSVTLLGSPSTSDWTDHISSEITYYYAVDAVNGTGTSGLSNIIGVTVDFPGPDPPVLDTLSSPDYDGALVLSWNDVDLTDTYTVYRYTSPIISINSSVTILGTTHITMYALIEPDSGVYYYAIQGMNGTGASGLSNTVSVVIVFPIDLDSITPNPSTDGVVNLNWDDVSGSSSYTVYRHTSLITEINESITLLGSVTISAYQDSGLTNGNYYYVVIANIAGEHTPISNCEIVNVNIKKRIPGFSVTYMLIASASIVGMMMWKFKKKS